MEYKKMLKFYFKGFVAVVVCLKWACVFMYKCMCIIGVLMRNLLLFVYFCFLVASAKWIISRVKFFMIS